MKRSTPLAAIAGAIIAGAVVTFYFQGQAATRSPATQALSLNTPLSGELSSKSLLNYSNGIRTALFTLKAEAGQLYRIQVSGALRSQISVLFNGTLVTRVSPDCDACGSDNAKNVIVFKAEHNGLYEIAVSGADTSAYGPFHIVAEALRAYDGTPLTAGQTITDWAQGKIQTYTLNINEDGLYRIDMRAAQSGLDPYLVLRNANDDEIGSDDDSGSNYDARLQAALKAGTYVIVANSAMETEHFNGGYTIAVENIAPPEGDLLGEDATLTLNVPPVIGVYSGETQHLRFTLSDPALLTADVHAQGFTADVELSTEQGSRRSNSRGERNRMRTVLQPGNYVLNVGGGTQSGFFSVALKTQPIPANAGGGPLLLNQPRHAVLFANSERDVYTLTIPAPGDYVLTMRAPNADSYLTLVQDGVTLATDDDSGGNTDAQIRASLNAGTYELHASTLNDGQRDRRYSISASTN